MQIGSSSTNSTQVPARVNFQWAPALAELHEIFLGQSGGSFELVAGKHYHVDTANAEVRKDASLAYKITRICLVPSMGRSIPESLETSTTWRCRYRRLTGYRKPSP